MQKTELKSEIKLGKYMNLLNDWGFKHVFSWDFKLKSVYIVGILNFVPKGKTDEDYIERGVD
ncbi:MAG: hypothetical protein LBQ50_02205 [Planctomycetaceae bacterium]|jgi:hypothetical protein|nr:hypothetical protein [Planctomycetaceae bacterium]